MSMAQGLPQRCTQMRLEISMTLSFRGFLANDYRELYLRYS